jgi:hypothetical protein
MANATRLHFDANVPSVRFWNLAINNAEVCSGFGYLRHLHRGNCDGHNSSYDFSAGVDNWLLTGEQFKMEWAKS